MAPTEIACATVWRRRCRPSARVDTERRLLLLTPPPRAPMRVHFRLLQSAETVATAVALSAAADRAEAAAAARADAAADHAEEEIAISWEQTAEAEHGDGMWDVAPTVADEHIDPSGALQLPDGVESIRHGAIVLRTYGPCRYPSAIRCVCLPERAPPPVARYDWDAAVLRLAYHGPRPAPAPPAMTAALAHGAATPAAITPAPATTPAAATPTTTPAAGASTMPKSTMPKSTMPATSAACRIVYNVDASGSAPALGGVRERRYDEARGIGLPLGEAAFAQRLAGDEPPPIVCAIAVVHGMWPSEPARFVPPHQLPPPPMARLDPRSRLLTLSEPPPGVEYRYTLDGSAPSLASPCYTAPVRLPRPPAGVLPASADCALQLRAAAFPANCAPSEELRMRLPLGQR